MCHEYLCVLSMRCHKTTKQQQEIEEREEDLIHLEMKKKSGLGFETPAESIGVCVCAAHNQTIRLICVSLDSHDYYPCAVFYINDYYYI